MNDKEHGEFAHEPARDAIPVEEWITTPISDMADYLDREDPVYLEEEEDAEEAPHMPDVQGPPASEG